MHHSRKTGFAALLCTAMVAALSFLACSSGSSGGGGTVDQPAAVTYTLKITQPAVDYGTITVEPKKSTYAKDEKVLVTAIPASGKAFTAWTGDLTVTANPAVITMDANKSISATFVTGISISAASNNADGGTVAIDPVKSVYTSGDSVKFTATPKTGYDFAGWSGDLSGSTNPSTVTVTKSMNVTALFSLKAATKYHLTVEVTPPSAGTVSLSTGDYAEGSALPVTATAARGYAFKNYTAGSWSSSSKNSTYTMPSADANLTATFDSLTARTVTAVANSADGGTVTINPASGPYYDGDTVRITATPKTGYAFTGWSDSSTDLIDVITVNGNMSLTANFKQPVLTLSCSGGVNPDIDVSPSGTVVSAEKTALPIGTSVTLTAPKVAGYTFYCWKQGSTIQGNDSSYSFTISTDISLTAVYVKNLWTIMVYMDGDNNLETNAIQDLNEMEGVDLRGSGISVIALLDRGATSGSDDTSNGNWTNTRLIPIKYDSNGVDGTIISQSIASSDLGLAAAGDELNMADPDTVTKFISAGKDYATAENYMFIFWDHGSGWRSANVQTASRSVSFVPGGRTDSSRSITSLLPASPRTVAPRADGYRAVCQDETSGNDMLYTKEIGTALSGKGITVVGFDLCLAGMMEVAYEVRNCASYMIASPEVTPDDGWEYDKWLGSFKAKTTKSGSELCKSVVDAYGTAYSSTTGACLAAYDLSKTDALVAAFSDVNQAACAYIKNGADVATRLNNASAVYNVLFNKTEDYYSVPGDLNIDVGCMAKAYYNYASAVVSPTMLVKLLDAVNNMVVCKWYNAATGSSGNPNGTGIAVHFTTIGLDKDQNIVSTGMDYAYFKDHSTLAPSVTNVPSFVDSTASQYWCPDTSTTPKSGLLGLLFFESDLYK